MPPDRTLKPSVQGRERRNIVTQLTVEAFLRVQPQTSMQ